MFHLCLISKIKNTQHKTLNRLSEKSKIQMLQEYLIQIQIRCGTRIQPIDYQRYHVKVLFPM
ncbi:unnamed protein product (macronuclear) [Paramecium tetraurelia]|uniref:Uncharacterized protein n=1 Tax=Paramecium tetraurelia TaxID=5888 RepID=A0CKG2_PARTE|nr:uncharacterized protein GSPATT00000993001 [Paramecium tetraurelia]CAK71279.1 unnamed protein product [Paramecium tetraurelia]|eukprot:XP_001438676.1 hypothetical protein (macronuclear) [Paramecium tetraurelia strain d4-2]